jgi:hypothetical protein
MTAVWGGSPLSEWQVHDEERLATVIVQIVYPVTEVQRREIQNIVERTLVDVLVIAAPEDEPPPA